MTNALLLAIQVAAPLGGDTVSLIHTPRLGPAAVALVSLPHPTLQFTLDDTVRRRPRAIEYSNGYYTRLKIHKYASFATLPLFAAEYFTGDRLYKDNADGIRHSGLTRFHAPIALTIGALFGVNTVTGVWNLWEGRKEPKGRGRRFIHSALMIASDAGFVLTAMAAGDAKREREGGISVTPNDPSGRNHHRALAIGSGSAALVGYLMMLIWKG